MAGQSASGQNAAEQREIPTLDNVRRETLEPLRDRVIRVQGIIGDYHQTTSRYQFHMNDGSNIEVVGNYPAMAHTTYLLDARVLLEDSQFVLIEIHKERLIPGNDSAKGLDPLTLAGGLVLVVAVITFVVMSTRSKTTQGSGMEQKIEHDGRQSEDPVKPVTPMPDRTIISIGAIEIIDGPHAGIKVPLQYGETRIGRATTNEIVLDNDKEISAQHGSLIITMEGRMIYRDDSTNGSLLDGIPVHRRDSEALSGTILEIGMSKLRITLRVSNAVSNAVSNVVLAPPLAPASVPQFGIPPASTVTTTMPVDHHKPVYPTLATLGAELEVLAGPDAGQRFAITHDVMGLGREGPEIVLSEQCISRKHATLVYRDGKFLLTDQQSKQGTRLNGRLLGAESSPLHNGDQIGLGLGTTILIFKLTPINDPETVLLRRP